MKETGRDVRPCCCKLAYRESESKLGSTVVSEVGTGLRSNVGVAAGVVSSTRALSGVETIGGWTDRSVVGVKTGGEHGDDGRRGVAPIA